MRNIMFIGVLLLCFSVSGQSITKEGFWQKDKITHSIGTFGISTATYTYLSIHKKHKKLPELQKRLISLSTAIIVGGLKEAFDSVSPNHKASWGDMGANAVGAFAFQVTVSIPLQFNKTFNKYTH